MHTLLWILSSCFIGGLLSVITAALVTLHTRIHLVSHLVSYAVGAMLGAVFLEILPHAFKLTNNIETTTFVVLFAFFYSLPLKNYFCGVTVMAIIVKCMICIMKTMFLKVTSMRMTKDEVAA